MADCIERGPLLEAFKAKCCEDCPGGYDRAKCKSWCDAADEIALVEDAPAVVPDVQRWRDPDKDPPKVETEVLVLVDCGKGYCITTAFYEDGTVSQYESVWQWEYRHFTPEDALECPIDKPVVGWMPLPPKEITK